MSSIYGLLLAVATHLSVTSSLLVLFVCFTVFSANTKTCYKRREPSYLMTIWSLFAVRNYRYCTPTEKTVREFLTEKKAIRVSCTIPINNNCCPLLRVVRCTQPNFTKGGGGGGGSPPVSHPFSFMHHFWQKRYPLWNTCYWQMVPFSHTQFRNFASLCSGGSRGGALGAWVPPYFSTKMRPEGPKNFFGDRVPLISRCGWPAPPPLSEGLDLPLLWTVVR